MSTENEDLKKESLNDEQLDAVAGGLKSKIKQYEDKKVYNARDIAKISKCICPECGGRLIGFRSEPPYRYEGNCNMCGIHWIGIMR